MTVWACLVILMPDRYSLIQLCHVPPFFARGPLLALMSSRTEGENATDRSYIFHLHEEEVLTRLHHFIRVFFCCFSFMIIMTNLLLLRPQHRLSNVRPGQPHICCLLNLQHCIHRREICSDPLQCSHNSDINVGFTREILLRHSRALLVLELCAGLLESFGNFVGNLLRGDGSIGAVDFGQSLSLWVP